MNIYISYFIHKYLIFQPYNYIHMYVVNVVEIVSQIKQLW